MGLVELHQINRWIQASKEALDRKEYSAAWSWANQGQHYVNGLIREAEAAQVSSDPEGSPSGCKAGDQ